MRGLIFYDESIVNRSNKLCIVTVNVLIWEDTF